MDRGFLETSHTSLYGQAYSANRWPAAPSTGSSGSHSSTSTSSFQSCRSAGSGRAGNRDTYSSSSGLPPAGMNNALFTAAAAAAACGGPSGGPGSWNYQPAPTAMPGTVSTPAAAATPAASAAQLIAQKSLRLRDLKRFRKVDLDQVCREIGVGLSGLKMDVYRRIVQHIEDLCRTVAQPAQAARLRRAYESIARLANYQSRATTTAPSGRTTVLASLGVSFPGGCGSSSSGGGSAGSRRLPLPPTAAGAAAASSTGASAQAIAQEDREVLRHIESNAFLRPQATVAGPQRLRVTGNGRSSGTITFNLSMADLERIRQSASEPRTQPGALRLMLRSARAGGAGARAEASSAVGNSGGVTVDGDWQLWPAETLVSVNGNFVQLKQRRVFFQGSTKKLKGDCEPFDIAPLCRNGLNRVDINCSDVEPFVFAVQLVQNVGVEEVLESIRQRPADSAEEGVKRVRRSFRGLPLDGSGGDGDTAAAAEAASSTGADDGADSDDELMATSTRLSLRCPLGLVPIRVPSRGRNCGHLQCFDLGTFLAFTERNSGAGWRCGVCHRLMAPQDVVVDTFLLGVVQQLGSRVDEVEEVDIFPDGRWEPGSSGDGASSSGGGRAERRRAAAAAAAGGSSSSEAAAPAAGNGSPVLLDLDDILEGVSDGDGIGGRAGPGGLATAAAAPAPASAGIVDLSLLSDDEDEEDRPISSLAMGAGGSGSGSGGSGNGSNGSRMAATNPFRTANPYASRLDVAKGAAGASSAAALRQYNPMSRHLGSSGVNSSERSGNGCRDFGGFSASSSTSRPSAPALGTSSHTVGFDLAHGSGGGSTVAAASNGKRPQQQQQQGGFRSATAVFADSPSPANLPSGMAMTAGGGSSSSNARAVNGAAAGGSHGAGTLVASTTATGVYIPQSPPAANAGGSASANSSRLSPSPRPGLALEPTMGQAYKRARVEQLEEREGSQYTGLEAAATAIGNPFDFGFGGGSDESSCGSKSAAGSRGAPPHSHPHPPGPLRTSSFDGLIEETQDGQESIDPGDYFSALESFQDSC